MNSLFAISIPKGRSRAPFMGVPVEGQRPLVFVTEQVRLALAGTKITDVAFIAANGNGTRALEITHRHNRGHGRIVLYDRCRDSWQIAHVWQTLRDWAEKQRKRRANGKSKNGKAAAIIRRLEKEKRGLWLHVPYHPLLPPKSQYDGKYLRESAWQWHQQKPMRKRVAQIAGMVLKGKITNTTGYRKLRELKIEFRRFSELRTHEREKFSYQDYYWRHVYQFCSGFCNGMREPYAERENLAEQLERHAEARQRYVADKRLAESLDSQIAALRKIADHAANYTGGEA